MKSASFNAGLGGVALAGVLFACASTLTTTGEVQAVSEPAWQRLDTSSLFLHDLTAGPATFAAAMKVAPDGSITSDMVSLHELRYMHSRDGLVPSRSRDTVVFGEAIDAKLLFNASSSPLMAYFEVAGGLAEIRILPGEAVAIGALPATVASQFQQGCKCVCSAVHPQTQHVIENAAHIPCSQVVPGHVPGTPCDSSGLVDEYCWFSAPVHPDMDGKLRDCKSGLIPASRHRDHG